jgi:hypothetical protein
MCGVVEFVDTFTLAVCETDRGDFFAYDNNYKPC